MQSITNKNSFINDLYQQASIYLAAQRFGKYANTGSIVKSFLLLVLYSGAYLYFLFGCSTLPQLLITATFLGLCHVLIPVNISHDAIHQSFSRRRWLNKAAFYAMELTGANAFMYARKHMEAHANKENGNKSAAIETQGLLLQKKEDGASKNLPPLFYIFYAQYMIFIRDFILFYNSSEPIPKKEFTRLYISKLLYAIAFFVVPFACIKLPWWQVTIALLLMYLIVTAMLVIILLMPTEKMENSRLDETNQYNEKWVAEILAHNVDFSPANSLLNNLVGGVNLNVVHYFFPDVHHVHYNKLSVFIEKTAASYNLLYRKQQVKDVFGIHINYLKNIHQQPAAAIGNKTS